MHPVDVKDFGSRSYSLRSSLEVFHDHGGLHRDDGGEVVACGDQGPVFGEVDRVRVVDSDSSSTRVGIDGAVCVGENRV